MKYVHSDESPIMSNLDFWKVIEARTSRSVGRFGFLFIDPAELPGTVADCSQSLPGTEDFIVRCSDIEKAATAALNIFEARKDEEDRDLWED